MTSALEGLKNNIGNYKGVMLCTRPNESIGQPKERPFISRVDPKDQLGINPVKANKPGAIRKKGNPVLQRHREWLEQFKQKIKEKRADETAKERAEREKVERWRAQNMVNRSRTKEETSPSPPNKSVDLKQSIQLSVKGENKQVAEENAKENKPVKSSLKKKEKKIEKPKWAYSENQLQEEEDKELNDLLEFTNSLDYDKYISDLEVRNMVSALKQRIDQIRNDEKDWKEKIVKAWNNDDEELRQSVRLNKVDIGDDKSDARSDVRSSYSDAKSVASERSHKSIQDLKSKKQEKKDWDNLSVTTKKNAVTIEERIAKHVADEILRNNTQFRHVHSNASVRKMLEREATKHLQEAKGYQEPKIIENKEHLLRKDYEDPNCLPYLHRNPAI